jgi:hypothetical protein
LLHFCCVYCVCFIWRMDDSLSASWERLMIVVCCCFVKTHSQCCRWDMMRSGHTTGPPSSPQEHGGMTSLRMELVM